MSNIEELLMHAELLVILLKDPHPGLVSWRIDLNKAIDSIAEFSG